MRDGPGTASAAMASYRPIRGGMSAGVAVPAAVSLPSLILLLWRAVRAPGGACVFLFMMISFFFRNRPETATLSGMRRAFRRRLTLQSAQKCSSHKKHCRNTYKERMKAYYACSLYCQGRLWITPRLDRAEAEVYHQRRRPCLRCLRKHVVVICCTLALRHKKWRHGILKGISSKQYILWN